jgi:glucose-1-phosphate cytidylyltransferase
MQEESMKVVILAGGMGTRLSEATHRIPKPLVEVGGYPILWHIMKCYSAYGFNEFVILLGYKGFQIKEFFADYMLHRSDVTIDLQSQTVQTLQSFTEPWRVTLLDTGLQTMTGGRIRRAMNHLKDGPFMLTYGDGVADIDLRRLVEFHQSHGGCVTMTSIQPAGRFGLVHSDVDHQVTSFREKPREDTSWINGGFFVCQPEMLNYLPDDDATVFEAEPLQNLVRDQQVYTFRHSGFWQCMDTLRDQNHLEELWSSGAAPWKVW